MIGRRKQRFVSIVTYASGSGDATNRLWALSRSEEKRIATFLRDTLGEPLVDTIVPRDTVLNAQEAYRDSGMVMMESPPDVEADAIDDAVRGTTRSLVGTVNAEGHVVMMATYGIPTQNPDGTITALPVPGSTVCMNSDEFDRWLVNMTLWNEERKR